MDTGVQTHFFLVDETVFNCAELNEITFEKLFGVLGFDAGDEDTGVLRVFEAFSSRQQGLMTFAIGMIDENPFFNEKESHSCRSQFIEQTIGNFDSAQIAAKNHGVDFVSKL